MQNSLNDKAKISALHRFLFSKDITSISNDWALHIVFRCLLDRWTRTHGNWETIPQSTRHETSILQGDIAGQAVK